MTTARLIAIGFIYVCATLAWAVLGGSLMARTGEFDSKLSHDAGLPWGGKHVQAAPEARGERPRMVNERDHENDAQGRAVTREVTKASVESVAIPLSASRVEVALHLDQRQKGLLWYDTYAVQFRGRWRVHNPDPVQRRLVVTFNFPSADAIYDGFVFTAGGERSAALTHLSHGVEAPGDGSPFTGGPIGISVNPRRRGGRADALS